MFIIKTDLVIIDEESIKDKIYYIRGKKVMIDSDLAKIYGYTTKIFNQQVKNNIDRFDSDFRFQITKEEYYKILRSKNLTLELKQGQYSKYLPYSFTEKGIYMLGNVLKSDKTIEISLYIINKFVELKNYYLSDGLLNKKIIHISCIILLLYFFHSFLLS